MTTATTPSITRDPIYYITAAFYALLTTALPALLGQVRFLPILQAIVLTTFIAVPLYHRHPRGALQVIVWWLPIQYITLVILTALFRSQIEQAIPNGFLFQGELAAWFYADGPLPVAVDATLGARLGEFAGVVVGSLGTAGLVGNWLVMRDLNLAAYSTGVLLAVLDNPARIPLTIPWWTLLRVAGYAGLVVVLAEPLLTYTWSPSHYWRNRRRLLLTSVALVIAGLLAEWVLPGLIAGSPRAAAVLP